MSGADMPDLAHFLAHAMEVEAAERHTRAMFAEA